MSMREKIAHIVSESHGTSKHLGLAGDLWAADAILSMLDRDAHQAALQKAYYDGLENGYSYGFSASCEGHNAEYPFGDRGENPESDENWRYDRDVMLADVPNKYEVK